MTSCSASCTSCLARASTLYWQSRIGALQVMLTALQDGLVSPALRLAPVYICGDFNARIGNANEFVGWSSDDNTVNSRGRSLIEWCIKNSMRPRNDFNSTRTAHLTDYMPAGASLVDYFVAEEHRSDAVVSVATWDMTRLVKNDTALDRLLMLHRHRLVEATLQLPKLLPSQQARPEAGRALIGTRNLDLVPDEARKRYVQHVNDALERVIQDVGLDQIAPEHVTDAIRVAAERHLHASPLHAPDDAAL